MNGNYKNFLGGENIEGDEDLQNNKYWEENGFFIENHSRLLNSNNRQREIEEELDVLENIISELLNPDIFGTLNKIDQEYVLNIKNNIFYLKKKNRIKDKLKDEDEKHFNISSNIYFFYKKLKNILISHNTGKIYSISGKDFLLEKNQINENFILNYKDNLKFFSDFFLEKQKKILVDILNKSHISTDFFNTKNQFFIGDFIYDIIDIFISKNKINLKINNSNKNYTARLLSYLKEISDSDKRNLDVQFLYHTIYNKNIEKVDAFLKTNKVNQAILLNFFKHSIIHTNDKNYIIKLFCSSLETNINFSDNLFVNFILNINKFGDLKDEIRKKIDNIFYLGLENKRKIKPKYFNKDVVIFLKRLSFVYGIPLPQFVNDKYSNFSIGKFINEKEEGLNKYILKNFPNLKFYTNYYFNGVEMDFYFPEFQLNIESDGFGLRKIHSSYFIRDIAVKEAGISVERYIHDEISDNKGVGNILRKYIKKNKK